MIVYYMHQKRGASAGELKFSQVFKAEDAGIVAIGEMEVQSISPDDRNVAEGKIIRDLIGVERFCSRPLIHTAGAWAAPTQLGGAVSCFFTVRPPDRDLGSALFDYLCRFDH